MASKSYVVFVGRETGVFNHWDVVKEATNKWPKAKHKSYQTAEEAKATWKHFLETGETPY